MSKKIHSDEISDRMKGLIKDSILTNLSEPCSSFGNH